MNTINKWALGMAFVMGLASCEMKEEIWGNDPISGDTGLLDLNIATTSSKNQISTKGTTDQVEEFPVTITGKDVDYNLSFASFAKFKEENPLTLPVGTFTIEAHSPGEFKDEMTEPYYGGTKEITIAKSTTTQDSISCTIQNVKISLDLTSSFLETYGEWEITVTDNNGHVKVYKNTDEDAEEPASIYWKLGDDVEIIYIKGSATTKDGQETVTINSSAKKSDLQEYEEGESTSFVGGDELVLTFTPVKVEGSTPGVEKDGIKITISGFNSEKNENISIDVDPGTDEPGGNTEDGSDNNDTETPQPGNGPTIQLPADITYSISAEPGSEEAAPESANAIISSSTGLKSVIIVIESGNSGFKGSLQQMASKNENLNFLTGVELVNNQDFVDLMVSLQQDVSLLQEGDKNYTFQIAAFFSMLNIFKATDADTPHKFIITAKDINDNQTNDTFSVTIKE